WRSGPPNSRRCCTSSTRSGGTSCSTPVSSIARASESLQKHQKDRWLDACAAAREGPRHPTEYGLPGPRPQRRRSPGIQPPAVAPCADRESLEHEGEGRTMKRLLSLSLLLPAALVATALLTGAPVQARPAQADQPLVEVDPVNGMDTDTYTVTGFSF